MFAPLAAKRVLVVDDERGLASAIVRRLQREGAVCTAAHSGTEASDLLAGGGYDLVVTDVQLPGHSGFEVLADALRMPEPPAVLLMAAEGEPGSAADALARGADGFLRKPADVEQVAHQSAVMLELRSLRHAVAAADATRAGGAALSVLAEVVSAAEKADPFRSGFSSRTSRLAVALAGPLGLSGEQLALAARVHDVGMLAVPVADQHAEELARPAQHLIRVHPTLGARWIERLGAERALVAAVAAHHERWDGGGYPGGLAGSEIPPLARALGTAAAIAAMVAPRPWRERYDTEAVLRELSEGKGTQFGSEEAEAAMELMRRMPGLAA